MIFSTEVSILKYVDSGKWEKRFGKVLTIPPAHAVLLLVDDIMNEKTVNALQVLVDRGFFVIVISTQDETPVADDQIRYVRVFEVQYCETLFDSLDKIEQIFAMGKYSYWLGLNLSQNFQRKLITDANDIVDCEREVIFIQSFDGIGDQLMLIPTIKTHVAKGRIVDVYARNKECFQNLPYIRRIYEYEEGINPKRYTAMYNTSFKLSSYEEEYCRQHRVKATAECAGLKGVELVTDKPEIILTEDEIIIARKMVQKSNGLKKIVVCFASQDIRRSYPIKLRQKLIDNLNKQLGPINVVVVGDCDMVYKHCINLVKKTNIRELFAVVGQADLVITIDSSVLHIAAAFDVPNILLPSIISGDWRKYKSTTVIKPHVKCHPCNGTYKNFESVECRRGESYCLSTIPQDEVVKQSQKLLKKIKNDNKEEKQKKIQIAEYKKEKSILLNRVSGLGDVLMVTAIANTIKENNPQTKISFRTNHIELLKDNPNIDKIIEASTGLKDDEFKEYDNIIDFDWCVESKMVSGAPGKCSEEDYMNVTRMDLFFNHAGIIPPKYPKMTYNVRTEETLYAKNIIKKLRGKYTVIYTLNATSAFRTMPVDISLEIISLLLAQKVNVIVVGDNCRLWGKYPGNFNEHYYNGIEEFDKDYFLDLTDKTKIRECIALVANCNLVIGPDTGIMHVTNALGVPCIGLFGNINPKLRCHYYDNVRTIWENIPCAEDCGDRSPSIQKNCPHIKDLRDWNLMEVGANCMQAISPKEVFDLAVEMIGLFSPGIPGSETSRIRLVVLPYCRGKGLDIGAVGDGQCLTIRDTSIIVDRTKEKDPALTVADFNSKCKESAIIADARDLSMIDDEKYNYLYSSHMLEDLEEGEIVDTLDGWFRVLKNNGYLIIYCPVQRVYVRHCINTGQNINRDHKIEYFSLRYIKDKLQHCSYKYNIECEIPLINNYSFLIVLKKVKR